MIIKSYIIIIIFNLERALKPRRQLVQQYSEYMNIIYLNVFIFLLFIVCLLIY